MLRTVVVLASLLLTSGGLRAQDTGTADSPLIVGTRNAPPFAIQEDDGTWSGLAIDLWRDVASRAGLAAEFRSASLREQLEGLRNGSLDAVAGALTMTADRERDFDFTHPFLDSGLGIATIEGRDGGLLDSLESIPIADLLSLIAWLLVSLVVTGGLVWLFERRKNPEQFGGGIRGFLNGVWWSAVTMTTVGYGDKAPVSPGGRLIGLVWMFSALFAVAAFTASMASTFTADRLSTVVQGVEDLPGVKVGTVSNSTSESYLEARGQTPRGYETVEAALAGLVGGEVQAVVYDKPILEFYGAREFVGRVVVLPEIFSPQRYAIALPDGSPIRERVNQEVLRVTGSSAWVSTLQRYLGE